MDRKLVGGAFVQGALPPIGEVVERIAQAGGTEAVGGDAEDGQLLAGVAGQGTVSWQGMNTPWSV